MGRARKTAVAAGVEERRARVESIRRGRTRTRLLAATGVPGGTVYKRHVGRMEPARA